MHLMPPIISNENIRLPNFIGNNRIFVNGKAHEVLHIKDDNRQEIAVVELNGLPHRISFSGTPRTIIIDGQVHMLAFGERKTFLFDGMSHVLRFGTPSRELYIGEFPLKGTFGGAPIVLSINGNKHEIRICGPPPEVKIEPEPSHELLRFVNEHRKEPQTLEKVEIVPTGSKKYDEIEVKELLSKLQKSGILKQLTKLPELTPTTSKTFGSTSSRPLSPPPSPVPSHYRLDIIKRLPVPSTAVNEFNMRAFLFRYDSVIRELHRERILCPTCGIEFNERGELYQLHLDEHLKETFYAKTKGYPHRCRPWYLMEDAWINHSEFENILNLPTKKKLAQDMAMETASNDDISTEHTEMKTCEMCCEEFEQYWDDDDDVWKFRDCIVQSGIAYHRTCIADAPNFLHVSN